MRWRRTFRVVIETEHPESNEQEGEMQKGAETVMDDLRNRIMDVLEESIKEQGDLLKGRVVETTVDEF